MRARAPGRMLDVRQTDWRRGRDGSPRDIATKEFPMRSVFSSVLAAALAAAGVLLLGPNALLSPDDALAAGIEPA